MSVRVGRGGAAARRPVVWQSRVAHVFACASSRRALVAVEEAGASTGQAIGLQPSASLQEIIGSQAQAAAFAVRQELLGIPNEDMLNFVKNQNNQPVLTAVGNPKDITPQDCRRLLKQQGEVLTEGVDIMGNTTLHWAVESGTGCHTMVPGLLKIKSNPNAQNKAGRTPLHIATEEGCLKCAILLLRFGASPSMLCGNGMTPIHTLSLSGKEGDLDKRNLTILEGILDEVDPSLREKILLLRAEGRLTLLHQAACHGNVPVCRFLVKERPSLARATMVGRVTPLHIAVMELQMIVVDLLSAPYAAEGPPPPSSGSTQTATASQRAEGEEEEEEEETSTTPLVMLFKVWPNFPLAQSGAGMASFIARSLVEKARVPLDAVDKRGCSALHYAALCGEEVLASVGYLLDSGADPTIRCEELRTTNGKTLRDATAAMVAVENKSHIKVTQLLLKARMASFKKMKEEKRRALLAAPYSSAPAAVATTSDTAAGVTNGATATPAAAATAPATAASPAATVDPAPAVGPPPTVRPAHDAGAAICHHGEQEDGKVVEDEEDDPPSKENASSSSSSSSSIEAIGGGVSEAAEASGGGRTVADDAMITEFAFEAVREAIENLDWQT